jgi:transcriptional regulator with XRE-family HTH domain
MARRRREANAQALGEKIRQARLAKGWTQEELARLSTLDRSYMGSLERGERNPSLDTLVRIARALHVKLASLVDDLPL